MFADHSQSCWDYMQPICPVFDLGSVYFWLVFLLVLLFLCADMPYFFRTHWDRLSAQICRQPEPPTILSTHIYRGICLTTRMSFSDNMSRAALFLRECDLAFKHFLLTSHLEDALKMLKATTRNSSNNLKFRKSVCLLQSYCIHTRLAWWDSHSLYVEQKLTCPDQRGTVCAVNYSRQTVQGTTVPELMHLLPMCTCLPKTPPPEIESWILCIKTINQQLTLSV